MSPGTIALSAFLIAMIFCLFGGLAIFLFKDEQKADKLVYPTIQQHSRTWRSKNGRYTVVEFATDIGFIYNLYDGHIEGRRMERMHALQAECFLNRENCIKSDLIEVERSYFTVNVVPNVIYHSILFPFL